MCPHIRRFPARKPASELPAFACPEAVRGAGVVQPFGPDTGASITMAADMREGGMGKREPPKAGRDTGKGLQSPAPTCGLGPQPPARCPHDDTEQRVTAARPSSLNTRLQALVERIAATRGVAIVVLRASELLIREPDGNARCVAPGSEAVYTHGIVMRAGKSSVVDGGEPPDVMVDADDSEIDLSRRLSLYERWALPEVWVAVPEGPVSRRREAAPHFAIHLLTRLGYVRVSRSAALPSWSAEEIHAALNEPKGLISERTSAALRRVGRLMHAHVGVGADDDPMLSPAQDELGAEPTVEDRVDAHEEMFGLRGFAVSPSFTDRVAALQRPLPHLLRAAYECRDEDDFLERIGVVREVPLVL